MSLWLPDLFGNNSTGDCSDSKAAIFHRETMILNGLFFLFSRATLGGFFARTELFLHLPRRMLSDARTRLLIGLFAAVGKCSASAGFGRKTEGSLTLNHASVKK
jgi:hypothetical protein